MSETLNARYLSTARRRVGTKGDLEAETAFVAREPSDPILTVVPFLETLPVTAKKHPYALLIGIVTAAVSVIGSIVGAVVFVGVAGFHMYGTQQATLTRIETLLQQNTEMRHEMAAIRKQQIDDMNAVRAYASNDSRRTEFIVGLMSQRQQRQVAQYDQSNPRLELPGTPGKKEN